MPFGQISRSIYPWFSLPLAKLASPPDLALIQKIKTNKYPDLGYDPYEPYVDFFSCDKMQTPLVDTPEKKARFIPSKHEHKKVMKIVRAIR